MFNNSIERVLHVVNVRTRFFSLLTTNFSRIGKDNYYILLALKKKKKVPHNLDRFKMFRLPKIPLHQCKLLYSNFFATLYFLADEYQKLLERKQSFMASHPSLLICMVLHEWIIADVDDGTALKNLVCALKDLTSNNFGQAVLTLGCVGMGANFETIQSILGGCAMGVLYGHPMSGKTTVLKAALSVIGQNDVIQRK